MDQDRLTRVTYWLGGILGVAYIVVGIAGWVVGVADDGEGSIFLWLLLLCGGGVLVLAGVLKPFDPPWISVAVVAIGAVAGALATLWSLFTPILAIAVIGLSVVRAKRTRTSAV